MATEVHLRRVVNFCEPVTSASSALLAFATEETFTGQSANLPKEAMELYKSVMGKRIYDKVYSLLTYLKKLWNCTNMLWVKGYMIRFTVC